MTVDLAEYTELTRAVIGCAMTVHRKLGRGFPEVVYQRALAIELYKNAISAEREVDLPIFYENEKSALVESTFSLKNGCWLN
nr:GxxExxY protein [Hymenobacter terricola]